MPVKGKGEIITCTCLFTSVYHNKEQTTYYIIFCRFYTLQFEKIISFQVCILYALTYSVLTHNAMNKMQVPQ